MAHRPYRRRIRNDCDRCPITAVTEYKTGKRFELHHFTTAGALIGLTYAEATDIAFAADFGDRQGLRAKLKAACGI